MQIGPQSQVLESVAANNNGAGIVSSGITGVGSSTATGNGQAQMVNVVTVACNLNGGTRDCP